MTTYTTLEGFVGGVDGAIQIVLGPNVYSFDSGESFPSRPVHTLDLFLL